MDKTFEQSFLSAIAALNHLDKRLVEIGMSGCTEFTRLQSAIIAHGAETHGDILHLSTD